MFWSALFTISIAQGLFLISLIILRGSKNAMASTAMIAMLVIMVLTNFGYLVAHSGLYRYIPQFFGIPFGMIFLLGPLFYFYSRAVTDHSFKWKQLYWLHFIPYAIQLMLNVPLLLMSKELWNQFISVFLSGNLPIRSVEKIIFAVQDVHLLVYILFIFRTIRNAKTNTGDQQYVVPIATRARWLATLAYCFSFFLTTVVALYGLILISGKYNPTTNYAYTAITSVIIYIIAYKLVLNPWLISPDFVQKYKTYMQFADNDKYLEKLTGLMVDEKIFTNSELKLATLASEVGLSTHQLSKLINEKMGKSFSDYVNEYRVAEFIKLLNDDKYKTYTIYGIALDAGFNSKSSFNTAFKKITGKTPSEFKPPNQQ